MDVLNSCCTLHVCFDIAKCVFTFMHILIITESLDDDEYMLNSHKHKHDN